MRETETVFAGIYANAHYNYHYDGRGNVSAVLNPSQNTVVSYRYDVFGKQVGQTGTFEQPYRFSTKFHYGGWDATALRATGLLAVDFGYRFDLVSVGKWLTKDPIGERGGLNLYGFVGNNMINDIDLLGLSSKDIEPGRKIDIYKNDHHGIRPDGEPHAHDILTGEKIGINTGNVYNRKGTKVVGKISKKGLRKLRAWAKELELIGIFVAIYEIYDAYTAPPSEAFDNACEFLEVLPPDEQQKAINEMIANRPDLFNCKECHSANTHNLTNNLPQRIEKVKHAR